MGLRGEVEALSAALRDERQEVSSLGSVRERLERELEGERGEREAQCERVGRLEIELRGAVERAQDAQETLKERAGEIERLEVRSSCDQPCISSSPVRLHRLHRLPRRRSRI
jgi:chromosome segregation ATPase